MTISELKPIVVYLWRVNIFLNSYSHSWFYLDSQYVFVVFSHGSSTAAKGKKAMVAVVAF